MSTIDNQLLLPSKLPADEVRQIVLTNIIKMLVARHWLSADEYSSAVSNITKTHNDDNIYKIKLSRSLLELDSYTFGMQEEKDVKADKKNKGEKTFDGTMVIVKLLPQKVTGVNKSPIITEFINTYSKYHKLLIVDSISDKAKTQLSNTPHTEVFNENVIMLNLLEHECSPSYEILSEKEVEELYSAYNITKRKMEKLYYNDAVSLYLYLKEGQIVRITRNNEVTGKSIAYRLVRNKDNLKN